MNKSTDEMDDFGGDEMDQGDEVEDNFGDFGDMDDFGGDDQDFMVDFESDPYLTDTVDIKRQKSYEPMKEEELKTMTDEMVKEVKDVFKFAT